MIRSISIRNFGRIQNFTYRFTDLLNIVSDRATDELSCAIGLVLNSKSTSSLPHFEASEETEISARVDLEGEQYLIRAFWLSNKRCFKTFAFNSRGQKVTEDYMHYLDHCEQQDHADRFDGDQKSHHLCLVRHLGQEDPNLLHELHRTTDGYTRIRSFRAYLTNFIKNFQPENLCEGKQYEIAIDDNGIYTVRHPKHGTDVYLSESEQRLFRYLCFLRTAEFWRGFEELRNINNVKKPLVVENFIEKLDDSIDLSYIANRTVRLGRQVILLSSRTSGY